MKSEIDLNFRQPPTFSHMGQIIKKSEEIAADKAEAALLLRQKKNAKKRKRQEKAEKKSKQKHASSSTPWSTQGGSRASKKKKKTTSDMKSASSETVVPANTQFCVACGKDPTPKSRCQKCSLPCHDECLVKIGNSLQCSAFCLG